MKIRSGFVSNSSSSSFICVGFKAEKHMVDKIFDKEKWELKEEYQDKDINYITECAHDKLIGIFIVDSDEYFPSITLDIKSIQEKIDSISEIFPEIPKEEIKIYGGTRSC